MTIVETSDQYIIVKKNLPSPNYSSVYMFSKGEKIGKTTFQSQNQMVIVTFIIH